MPPRATSICSATFESRKRKCLSPHSLIGNQKEDQLFFLFSFVCFLLTSVEFFRVLRKTTETAGAGAGTGIWAYGHEGPNREAARCAELAYWVGRKCLGRGLKAPCGSRFGNRVGLASHREGSGEGRERENERERTLRDHKRLVA